MPKAVLHEATGSVTQGAPNVIGMRKPPRAPIAPAIPITAEASLVDLASAAYRSTVPSEVALSACAFQMCGIIRYVEPLPMPVAAKTNRKASRKNGKMLEL